MSNADAVGARSPATPEQSHARVVELHRPVPPHTDATHAHVRPAFAPPTLEPIPGGQYGVEEPAVAYEPIGPVRRDATLRRLLALADVIAALTTLGLIDTFTGMRLQLAGLLSLPLIIVISKLMGRYDHDDLMLAKSTLDEVPSLLGVGAGWSLTWSLLAFVSGESLGVNGGGGVAVLCLTCAAMLVVTRSGARTLGKVFSPKERVLIIGTAHARERLAQSLSTDPGARIEIVGFLPLEDERRHGARTDWGSRTRRKRIRTFDDLGRVVHELGVQRVFLIPTSADNETMLEAVSKTTALGVNVSVVPRLLEVVGSAVEFDTVGGVTVLGVRRPGLNRSSRAVKRAMDIVGSGLGLIVLSPVFLIVAIAIKLGSPGPVFFRQARVGRRGRHFNMLKFRSMIDGAEDQREALAHMNETDGLFKVKNDPRVTPVGRIVRRASIDELPQLLNVLRGDMSLVGPRPLVADEDALVEGRHRERLQLAPGMTGPWQVLGPTRPPLSEMVKTDYLYATNWSLWTDVKIILRTFAHVAARRGV